MDHNPPTSSDPFDFDPIIFDDELIQLITSIFPQTHQNHDVFPASTQNQAQDHNTIVINNSFHASPQAAQPSQHNVVEFNSIATPTLAPSKGKGKGKAKAKAKAKAEKCNLKAMEIERKRRQEMSSLYQELRSLLPADAKRKRFISDLLQETTNHINNLQLGIKGLNNKREGLLRTSSSAGSSSSSHNSNSNQQQQQQNHQVTVKPCKDGFIEVIVSTSAPLYNGNENNRSIRLSKVLHLLSCEGLNVMNCVSSRINSKFVHTIRAQVDDGRGIDLCLLQQKLTQIS